VSQESGDHGRIDSDRMNDVTGAWAEISRLLDDTRLGERVDQLHEARRHAGSPAKFYSDVEFR
jgi:hypothetical protein